MRKFMLGALLAANLTACGLLRPSLDTAALTPQTSGQIVAAPELPFISPTAVGRWVAINPAELQTISGSAWVGQLAELGFTGLPALLAEARTHNASLGITAARLTQAQAESGSALAALFPSVGLTSSAQRQRNAPGQLGPNSQGNIQNRYNAGASASWTLDIFGRVFNGFKVAAGLEDASAAQYAATQLQLQQAVAQTYLGLLAATETARAWQVAIGAAEEQNRLTQLRYAAGDIGVTEAQPVFATLQGLRVQALAATQQRVQLENALNTLLGRAPQKIELTEADLAALGKPALPMPLSVSSTALLQRPDVRAAAATLAASNANIGVARAAFLPSISLQANGGFNATSVDDLLNWSQRTWAVGPVVSLPIFQGGALRANLKRSWGVYEEAVATYRQEVLGVYEEVSNALSANQIARASAQSATEVAAALAKVTAAQKLRYEAGDVAKTEWLGSQILAAQARASAASANAAAHAAVVNLATALGE